MNKEKETRKEIFNSCRYNYSSNVKILISLCFPADTKKRYVLKNTIFDLNFNYHISPHSRQQQQKKQTKMMNHADYQKDHVSIWCTVYIATCHGLSPAFLSHGNVREVKRLRKSRACARECPCIIPAYAITHRKSLAYSAASGYS